MVGWFAIGANCGRLSFELAAEPGDALGEVDADVLVNPAVDAPLPAVDAPLLPMEAGLQGDAKTRADANLDAPPQDETVADASAPEAAAPILRQDFEADVASWNRMWATSGTSVTRTTTLFHNGSAAMSVVGVEGSPNGTFERVVEPPIREGNLFLRAFFYIPSRQTVRSWLVLMEAKSEKSAHKISFNLNSTMNLALELWGVGVFTAGPVVLDRWFCAEIELAMDPTRGHARLFVDGRTLIERTNLNSVLGAGADYYRVGMLSDSQQSAFSVFVDDFVVSRSGVGCGP